MKYQTDHTKEHIQLETHVFTAKCWEAVRELRMLSDDEFKSIVNKAYVNPRSRWEGILFMYLGFSWEDMAKNYCLCPLLLINNFRSKEYKIHSRYCPKRKHTSKSYKRFNNSTKKLSYVSRQS